MFLKNIGQLYGEMYVCFFVVVVVVFLSRLQTSQTCFQKMKDVNVMFSKHGTGFWACKFFGSFQNEQCQISILITLTNVSSST